VVFVFLDDRISAAKWLTEEEAALLEKNIAAGHAEKEEESLMKVFASARGWLLAIIYFSFVMGIYGVSFWLPTIIKAMGIADPLQVGMMSAIPALLGALGLILSVIWADNTVLAMAALTLATSGILCTLPMFWSLPTAFLAGTGAAAGIAMINSLGNLSGFISPYAVGWLKELTASTYAGMYLLSAVLIVGALLTLKVPAHIVNK